MTDILSSIREALLALPELESVTRGHPPVDARLPCAAYALTDERPAARYDDAAYLRRAEATIRLFAGSAAALDAPAAQIDAALAALGMERAFMADSSDGIAHQRTMRYTITQ